MKTLGPHDFNLRRCSQELDELDQLLQDHPELSERDHIQPFFEQRKDLVAFLGSYAPNIGTADRIAFKYPVVGDFEADLIIGNAQSQCFMIIELEDGGAQSIFKKTGRKTSEWAARFEHGFSQIVDWFCALDDFRQTQRFAEDFGHGHVTFLGMLAIGRSASLDNAEQRRLQWRTERVLINSNQIHCITFDGMLNTLRWRLRHYLAESQGDISGP